MSKLFYFDVETTGLDAKKHGIHQLSGAIEIDGKIVEKFNQNVKPFGTAVIEPDALKIAGVTIAQISTYRPEDEVYRDLIAMLNRYCDKYVPGDKFFLVGFNNASFDNQFLREFFLRNGDKYFGSYFWSGSLDVFILATQKLMGIRHTMADFKLRTVAETLGIVIDESKLHDAMYDIEITREILKRLENKEQGRCTSQFQVNRWLNKVVGSLAKVFDFNPRQ